MLSYWSSFQAEGQASCLEVFPEWAYLIQLMSVIVNMSHLDLPRVLPRHVILSGLIAAKQEVFFMPHIQITLLEGRTPEQKRKIVERVTNTMIEEAGTAREGVSVAFVEVPTASFARGGVLALDQQRK